MKRAILLLGSLLLVSCFDTPVKTSVDLERGGLSLERDIRFRYSERYSYGFAFRPTFIAGDSWHIARFRSEEPRAWQELCPSVELVIKDPTGEVVLTDASRIASEEGWTMTNGSQDAESPASVYKFITFTPDPQRRYRLTLRVTQPCPGANALEPRFFIQRPISGP